nr:MAG TPA: hypothetical protein [Inoviridae sp.]
MWFFILINKNHFFPLAPIKDNLQLYNVDFEVSTCL